MNYTRVDNNGNQTISLFFEAEDLPMPINNTHPAFPEILRMCEDGTLTHATDGDVTRILSGNRELLEWADTDEYETDDVFLEQEIDELDAPKEVIDGLKKILGSFDPKAEDHIHSIINFLDRVEKNPAEIEVGKFLRWAMNNGIVLTKEGYLVGYKSLLEVDPDDWEDIFGDGTHPNGDETDIQTFMEDNPGKKLFRPSHRGPGITDGVSWDSYIPMYVGATVEMPRDSVDPSGSVKCSVGLHVGNFEYAKNFNSYYENESLGLVLVDPADIISVPDYAYDKYRVCRYRMIHEGLQSELHSSLYVGETYGPVVSDPDPEPIAGFQEPGNISHSTAFSRLVTKLKGIFTR